MTPSAILEFLKWVVGLGFSGAALLFGLMWYKGILCHRDQVTAERIAGQAVAAALQTELTYLRGKYDELWGDARELLQIAHKATSTAEKLKDKIAELIPTTPTGTSGNSPAGQPPAESPTGG